MLNIAAAGILNFNRPEISLAYNFNLLVSLPNIGTSLKDFYLAF
jgi:hypothetical protein